MTDRSRNQAETRRKVSSALARVFAFWRTGLPRPVLVLQGGNALNYFGTGLILPFEIIYLHAVRGFSTATAGLVLATVMGTAAVVTLPSGALLDRFSAKRFLIAGNVVNALGYGGLAFVDRPWQGFVCSAVGGAGFGFVGTAGQVLTLTLVPAEQRAASTALRRVAGNFGLGLGATVAGFIVAATHHHLQAFQSLYLFDAVTFVVFALVVLVWIPDPGLADAPSASEGAQGFRAVARDRLLLALIAGNLALVLIGGAFFSNILPPFAVAHTPLGAGEIGVVVFINTFFIVVAQVPATRVVARMRRTHALFATSAIFAVGLLAVLLATLTHSTLAATTVLAGVAILIAIAECGQFHRARPASRGNRAAASARPLHVALPAQLHGRRGSRPRGRRRAARNVTRHHLVGRRPGAGTDRSRLPSTRKPDTRPPLAYEIPAAAGRVRGDLMRRGMAGAGSSDRAPIAVTQRGETRCQ